MKFRMKMKAERKLGDLEGKDAEGTETLLEKDETTLGHLPGSGNHLAG